jgi:peptidoglycan/xylan/chitin deacetylase (PgdA/CDA1 family)
MPRTIYPVIQDFDSEFCCPLPIIGIAQCPESELRLSNRPKTDQSQTSSQKLYLLYHELRPGRSNYSYIVETRQFEQHLNLFQKLRESEGSMLRPEITFDDGHISNFEFAPPALQSHNIKAHFFITVGWTGKRPGYMDWEHLRDLQQAGHIIGAHGWTHTLLTHCNEKELHHELADARLALEQKLGTPVITMSLPGGRYNRRVLAACQQAGYKQIFTSIPKAEPEPSGLTIGRLNIRGDMHSEWLSKLFQPGGNVLPGLERQYQRKEAAKSLLGDRLYAKLWAILNRKEPETDAGETARQ